MAKRHQLFFGIVLAAVLLGSVARLEAQSHDSTAVFDGPTAQMQSNDLVFPRHVLIIENVNGTTYTGTAIRMSIEGATAEYWFTILSTGGPGPNVLNGAFTMTLSEALILWATGYVNIDNFWYVGGDPYGLRALP